MVKDILLYVMAAFYIYAGVSHFLKPKFFMMLMPPYIPWHKQMVDISGVIEIGLGLLLLFPDYRDIAAWGIIALLIAVFPANIYHIQANKLRPHIAPWFLYLRLPLQGVLILWAYWYT